jgi:hypothetical protein
MLSLLSRLLLPCRQGSWAHTALHSAADAADNRLAFALYAGSCDWSVECCDSIVEA